MQTFRLMFILTVSAVWAKENMCSRMKAIQRVPSSASGRWILVATNKRDMMDKANLQARMPQCGGLNSATPCLCSGFDLSSDLQEPLIPEYNVTSFSFNMRSGEYDFQYLKMELANNKSDMAVFTLGPIMGGNKNKILIKGLATDDHQSFMLLQVCNDTGDELDIWFLSKTPMPTEASVNEAKAFLKANELDMTGMVRVTQASCEYPPPQTGGGADKTIRITFY